MTPKNVLNSKGRAVAFNVANADEFKRLCAGGVALLERLHIEGDIRVFSLSADESKALFALTLAWAEAPAGASAFPCEFQPWEGAESYAEIHGDRANITFYGDIAIERASKEVAKIESRINQAA